MANELEVDAAGLLVAAARSETTVAELATGTAEGVAGTYPSQAGVAAILAAAQFVRTRQSQRISKQAEDLAVGGARYDTTDSEGGDAIATVSM